MEAGPKLMGLEEARTRLKALASARAEELHRKAEALEAMRRTLVDLAANCHGDRRPECPILDRLAGEATS